MSTHWSEGTASNHCCYADETGKDFGAQFFLVAVILPDKGKEGRLRQHLEEIKGKTSRYKWTKSSHEYRQRYLESIMEIVELKEAIYYSLYQKVRTDEISLIVQTIVAALKKKGMGNQRVDIIIDALSKSRKRQVERAFANAGIECGQIYCHQTEQDVVLQLADYMAGFLRDYEEKRTSSRQEQGYPETVFNKLRGKLGITKLVDERIR
jgi:Protein of unknown function (DUF3800)